jgi:hypothetical protein
MSNSNKSPTGTFNKRGRPRGTFNWFGDYRRLARLPKQTAYRWWHMYLDHVNYVQHAPADTDEEVMWGFMKWLAEGGMRER